MTSARRNVGGVCISEGRGARAAGGRGRQNPPLDHENHAAPVLWWSTRLSDHGPDRHGRAPAVETFRLGVVSHAAIPS